MYALMICFSLTNSCADGCIYDDDNARRVKYVYDQGHQVASHTWAHKDLTELSDGDLRSEFSRTNNAIRKITGAFPAFMRSVQPEPYILVLTLI